MTRLVSRIRLPLLLCGAFSTALAALGIRELSSLRIARVEVSGTLRSSPVAVRHLADVRVGDRLMGVDLEAVARAVMRHPWVASASVRRVFPDGLRIAVTEQRTAMLLEAGGALYRVNSAGEVFKRARSRDLDYPVLGGLAPGWVDRQGDLSRAVVLHALHILDALDGRAGLRPDAVSELRFDPDLGFSVLLRHGAVLRLGFRDPSASLDRLAALSGAGLDLDSRVEVDLDIDSAALVVPLQTS